MSCLQGLKPLKEECGLIELYSQQKPKLHEYLI